LNLLSFFETLRIQFKPTSTASPWLNGVAERAFQMAKTHGGSLSCKSTSKKIEIISLWFFTERITFWLQSAKANSFIAILSQNKNA